MADAVEVAIPAALLDRIKTYADARPLPIAMPNKTFVTPAPGPSVCWLRATYLPAPTSSFLISNTGPNRHYGFLQVDVFFGLNGGELAPGRIAAEIITLFKRGTFIMRDGFTVRIDEHPQPDPASKDEAWLMLPVRIPYQCFARPA